MNIAEYFIKNRVISWMLLLILGIGGAVAFLDLGQLEDPEFTIKDALVITQYPGASAQQVEEEVTYPLEKAIQQLSYIDEITSISSAGLSQITVTMQDRYDAQDLPQIWDELRRKITDVTPSLPPGVQTPLVNDDFGDVFGMMLAVSGKGYSYKELQDYVDFLRRELELVPGVGKVNLAGTQQEQVFIEISYQRLAAFGISPQQLHDLLKTQNAVSPAGSVSHGSEYIRIQSSGEFDSVEQLENLLIAGQDSGNLVYLRDIAEVSRGFQEIPTNLYNFNGLPAVNMGISFASGSNVVKVGEAIRDRLAELGYARPVGMQVDYIYDQPSSVDASVKGFVVSLGQAVGIVIVVLLLFMGLKSGLLIGAILLLTVFGTFIFMHMMAIDLQRISLGALIIALGMLVDNAIVVVEGILVGRNQGKTTRQAAVQIVKQTIWPLLGATVIAIAAFAPIGLSQDATGEFTNTLFWVLLVALLLSWFTAVTLTPFLASLLFGDKQPDAGTAIAQASDPYQGLFFAGFKLVLDLCLRFRYVTIAVLIGLLVLAGYGFTKTKQTFFPPATTPIFLADIWLPEGTDIRVTHSMVHELEEWLLADEDTKQLTSTTGQGAQRFMLTYSPEKAYSAYAQLLVETHSAEQMQPLMAKLREYTAESFPQALLKLKFLEIGPSPDAKIEARFIGPDPDVLRSLGEQAKAVLRADGNAWNIRDDWREKTKLVQPQFDETLARRVGVTRDDLNHALQNYFAGVQVGLYRDGADLLPIISRLPSEERVDISQLSAMPIWSPQLQQYVPLQQVAPRTEVIWEDPIIQRRDRKRTLTVMADHDVLGNETAAEVFNRVRPQIEAIELPTGYELTWGGEYYDSTKASNALFGSLPMGFFTMFVITVVLFSSIRQPLVIWCTVPLALIGVTSGLLLLDAAFGFMALLGFLSLSGMLLKNGIVLLDQINLETNSGTPPYHAVFNSTVSRVRPVAMAAITTVLGMVPLLADAFFFDMAVTIMFGLGFATVLTLLVVPTLYVTFFGIAYEPQPKTES